MHIVVHNHFSAINAEQWNALLKSNNPFMRHEFLLGLEQCHCVCDATGWQAKHIAIYADDSRQKLLAAMPCYIKMHSYGEYIFDWAWADAHQRHGLNYYPKLSNAVPFTPASGERYLINPELDQDKILKLLIDKALKLVDENQLSSFHSLFISESQSNSLCNLEPRLLKRISTQFHWRNKQYSNFDDYLALMSSKKRKNIKRERRRVIEMGIVYEWLTAEQLNQENAQKIHQFYSQTINQYGAQAYLSSDFFNYLSTDFNQQTLFLFAKYEGQIIAGGLYFKSDDTLYGRYWGALENFHSVHFETCYYQAIEWCIQQGYQYFEAGAQGQHKLARGLEPSNTYSCHMIKHPEFHQAIAQYIKQEQSQLEDYTQNLQAHSPFKTDLVKEL